PAEIARELALRLAALGFGLGGNEIADRLGLQQIELAVEKGAAREFAGFGEPQPEPAERLHDGSEHSAAAMQMKLGDIFCGHALRCRKPQHEPVIEALSTLRIDHPAAARNAWGQKAPDERRYRSPRLRPGNADDRDSGAPGCRRRSKDRVGMRLGDAQCFGGSWSGVSISRWTRPPFLTCVSRISSMSC